MGIKLTPKINEFVKRVTQSEILHFEFIRISNQNNMKMHLLKVLSLCIIK